MLGDPTSLLGTVYAGNTAESVSLGGYRTLSGQSALGWQWIDGTSAAAINCGALNCGPWASGEPMYVFSLMIRAYIPANCSHVLSLLTKGHMQCISASFVTPSCSGTCCTGYDVLTIWAGNGLDDAGGTAAYVCEADVCPLGKYSKGGIGPSSCSGVCSSPAGSYCGLGMTSAAGALCPAGTYGAVAGLATAECSGQCPVGQYSLAGATACSPCPTAVTPGTSMCMPTCPVPSQLTPM